MTVTEIKLPPTATNASQVIIEICKLHERYNNYECHPQLEFENTTADWEQYRVERDQILIKHNYTAEELANEAKIRINDIESVHHIIDILFE